jgi:hypothetical protein
MSLPGVRAGGFVLGGTLAVITPCPADIIQKFTLRSLPLSHLATRPGAIKARFVKSNAAAFPFPDFPLVVPLHRSPERGELFTRYRQGIESRKTRLEAVKEREDAALAAMSRPASRVKVFLSFRFWMLSMSPAS